MEPYVKRQKNDAAEAGAICEAVTRANMRFVVTQSVHSGGALAVMHYLKIHAKYRPWLNALLARRPTKIAAIALANKIAKEILNRALIATIPPNSTARN